MSKQNAASKGTSSGLLAFGAIIVCLIVAYIIYAFLMGAKGNFEGGDPIKGHPLNALGIVYKGGPIVPILLGTFLSMLAFTIERAMTVVQATGKGSIPAFVKLVQSKLAAGDINGAVNECDKQRGSVANVVKAGLAKYDEMTRETGMEKDEKVLAITQAVEEAKALEMPILERNLPILSTIASVGTLIALLGTVIGMIKAFTALASSGAPDAVALSTGISEALINTALGIGTSAIAIIVYNFFTAQIDGMSYRIDEAGFSMAQTFATHHK